MRTILSLVWGEVRVHRVRMLLTVLGVGAATATVVWAYGSFATRRAQAPALADELLGRYTGWITCHNPHSGRPMPDAPTAGEFIAEDVLARIRTDPRIALLTPVYQTPVECMSRDSKGHRKRNGPPFRPMTAAITAPTLPGSGIEGRGLTLGDAQAREAVILDSVAKTLSVGLGESLFYAGPAGETRVQVVGILPTPLDRWDMPRFFPAAYVSRDSMRAIQGLSSDERLPNNAAYIALKNPRKWDRFAADWRAASKSSPLWFLSTPYLQGELNAPQRGYGLNNHFIVALALLGALFVIFTTLNIGFGERVRFLGMLRVIGMHRGPVALTILFESLLAGFAGFCVSLVFGWLILHVMIFQEPDLFPRGVRLDGMAVGISAATALSGSLLAAVLPFILALRLKPLDVMTRQLQVSNGKVRYWMGGIGILLLLPSVLVVSVLDLTPHQRIFLSSAVGLPCLGIGVVLLIPGVCQGVERLLSPWLGRVLQLPSFLCGGDLSRHTWRSMGVVLSITVGLGLFMAFKTWGHTMLKPYRPTDAVPDLTIGFFPEGLPRDQVDEVRNTPGIRADRCLPLTLRQVPLGRRALAQRRITWKEEKDEASRKRSTPSGRDAMNVLLVGLDPQAGLGGDDPVLRLSFKNRSREEVLANMARGNHCMIPESLANLIGLRPGDTLPVVPRLARRPLGTAAGPQTRATSPSGGERPREEPEIALTVAGIYTDPWHLMTSWTGMRGQHGTSFRCDGMVLVREQDALRIPGTQRVTCFWASMSSAYRDKPTGEGAAEIRSALEALAARQKPYRYKPYGSSTVAVMKTPSVRLTTREFLIENCLDHANDIFHRLSRLPIFALLLSALAVANTVMASIRSRRWEFGILRGLGLTRSRLLRLLLADAIVIATAATLVSLIFGIVSGYCVAGIARVASSTRGLPIDLVVPWADVGVGIALTFAITLAATLPPAMKAARHEPLALLQEGRAAV